MATLIQAFQALHPRRWFTGLWLNSDFRKLWGSLTIVHFGGQITFLALPLTAALVLNASPFEVGVLTALEALPYPICGLFAGVLVDRAKKLPVIIACDMGRGLALLAIPLCAWFGVLSMGVLYVVGFVVGMLSVAGWPAYQVFMTERVGRENLVEANAKIGVCDSAAQLIGPGIAGALIQWLTAPFALAFDALSFFLSAWMLRGIPPKDTDAPRPLTGSMWEEIREAGDLANHRCALVGRSACGRSSATLIAIVVLYARASYSPGHGRPLHDRGLGSPAAAGIGSLNARYGMGR